MRRWCSHKLYKALSVDRGDGTYGVVASGIGVRAREADGRDIALFSQGDSFDLVYGHAKGPYIIVELSPATLLKLAWFVLWKWWARGTWFGLKLSAWNWCCAVQLEEAAVEKSARLHKRIHHANRQEEARSIR